MLSSCHGYFIYKHLIKLGDALISKRAAISDDQEEMPGEKSRNLAFDAHLK